MLFLSFCLMLFVAALEVAYSHNWCILTVDDLLHLHTLIRSHAHTHTHTHIYITSLSPQCFAFLVVFNTEPFKCPKSHTLRELWFVCLICKLLLIYNLLDAHFCLTYSLLVSNIWAFFGSLLSFFVIYQSYSLDICLHFSHLLSFSLKSFAKRHWLSIIHLFRSNLFSHSSKQSRIHTHTHTHTLSLYLSISHLNTHSLSFSLSSFLFM